MRRGTTPTFIFTLPMNATELAAGFVTFAQGTNVVIDKPLSEWKIDGNKVTIDLSQQETLCLDAGCNTEIQMRVRTKSGRALATNITSVPAERILKDGEI